MMLNALPAEIVAKVLDHAENQTIARLRRTNKYIDSVARNYKLDKIRPPIIRIVEEDLFHYWVYSTRKDDSTIRIKHYVLKGSDVTRSKTYARSFNDVLRKTSQMYGDVQHLKLHMFQKFDKNRTVSILKHLKPLRRNRTILTMSRCVFDAELTELSDFFNFFDDVKLEFDKTANHFTDQFLLAHKTSLHIKPKEYWDFNKHYDFRHITDLALTKFEQDSANIPTLFLIPACVTSFSLHKVVETIEMMLPLRKKLQYDFGYIKVENGDDNSAYFDRLRTFPSFRRKELDSNVTYFSCGYERRSKFTFKTIREFTYHFNVFE